MNNTNYDIEFEKTKARVAEQNAGNKLLLHVCCAPCATYCLTRIADVFDVTLFFENDNIFPEDEWQKRLGEVQKLVKTANDGLFESVPKFPLKLIVSEYSPQRFFEAAHGYEAEREGGARCARCFELRLKSTFCQARIGKFDFFGTTLTVSPYKNSQLLNKIGLAAATQENENLSVTDDLGKTHDLSETLSDTEPLPAWLPSDFKKHGGYNESIRLSQKYCLYRQHYCGCAFSAEAAKQSAKTQ